MREPEFRQPVPGSHPVTQGSYPPPGYPPPAAGSQPSLGAYAQPPPPAYGQPPQHGYPPPQGYGAYPPQGHYGYPAPGSYPPPGHPGSYPPYGYPAHPGGGPPPVGYPPPGCYPPPGSHAGYPPPMGWYPPPLPYPVVANGGHPDAGYRPRSHSRSRSRSRSGNQKGERRRAQPQRFKAYHSKNVPKAVDLEAQAATSSEAEKTTAMLRNIPNKYMQSDLLAEIDHEGFSGQYDFFYLPMDVQNRTNVGYAFINFIHSSDMRRFCDLFAKRQFSKHASTQKIAAVSPAHINGLRDNVQHLSKKAVSHFKDKEYQPIILRNGRSIPFKEVLDQLERGEL